MDEVATRYSKAETATPAIASSSATVSGSASHYYVNPPRPLIEAREPSEKVAPAESSDDYKTKVMFPFIPCEAR